MDGPNTMFSDSESWPFWFKGGLSPATLTYAVLLTVVAAAVVGVLPGLKVTREWSGARLSQATAGAGGLRMSGIWTGVIIAQIAVTVLFTGVAYVLQIQASRISSMKAAFPAEEYLAVRLEMDFDSANSTEEVADTNENSFLQHYSTTVRELKRQLALEPTVAAVTLAERLPLIEDTGRLIEVDEGEAGELFREVGTAAVDLDYFEVFQTPVRAGRGFDSSDVAEGASTAVVNRLFVDKVLAGRNAIGRRIRYTTEDSRSRTNPEPQPGPWLEIVGVVPDLVLDPKLPMNVDNPVRPIVYSPLGRRQEQIYPLYLAAHVRGRGDPTLLSPTLRQVAGDLSPALRLNEIQALDQATSSTARFVTGMANTFLLVSALGLFLSLAGIYSVISFTVSRRTREIAIRVALGAQAPRVIADTLGRPLSHVAAGVAAGCVLMACLVAITAIDNLDASAISSEWRGAVMKTMMTNAPLLLGYGIAMLGVCALSCIGPILRALRLEPTQALREDA